MADLINLGEMLPAMLETLETEGEVSFTVTGNSMFPMLRNREDKVWLKKPVFSLKKYDIPFYIRSDGRFVLHRIIKTVDGGYIIRGDNCNYIETDITDDKIIAVVKRFKRGKHIYSVDSAGYKIYCRLYCNGAVYFLRRVLLKFRSLFSRIKHFLKP